jgi:hypothetical protein
LSYKPNLPRILLEQVEVDVARPSHTSAHRANSVDVMVEESEGQAQSAALPAFGPDLPMQLWGEAEEVAYWAGVFAERGVPDPADANHDLEAAYGAWRADPDKSNDARHAREYAEAAIRAGLPFYGGGDIDLGAVGWRRWAGEDSQ